MELLNIKKVKDQLKNDRRERFLQSIPVFQNYDSDRRGFLFCISTIAATIGAFSFLLFDSDRLINEEFLIIGDVMLLLTIIFSSAAYLVHLRRENVDFETGYYSQFEKENDLIDSLSVNGIDGFINPGQLSAYQLEYKYNRPQTDSYSVQWVSWGLLLVSLAFISLSFFSVPDMVSTLGFPSLVLKCFIVR